MEVRESRLSSHHQVKCSQLFKYCLVTVKMLTAVSCKSPLSSKDLHWSAKLPAEILQSCDADAGLYSELWCLGILVNDADSLWEDLTGEENIPSCSTMVLSRTSLDSLPEPWWEQCEVLKEEDKHSPRLDEQIQQRLAWYEIGYSTLCHYCRI